MLTFKFYNNAKLSVAVLIAVIVVVRFIMLLSVDVINGDAIRYFNSANELMAGNVQAAFEHEKMLVYAFSLGIANSVIGDWVFSGLLISVLFQALTLFPLYMLTKELFGSMAAMWTGITFILLPAANELSTKVVKDSPFLFFMMMALWFGQKGMSERKALYFLITFLCGALAATFRLEAILFLLLYFAWLFAKLLFNSNNRNIALIGLVYYSMVPIVILLAISLAFFMGFINPTLLDTIWLRFSQHYLSTDLLGSYRTIYNHLESVEGNFPGGQWSNDFFEAARDNLPLIYFTGMMQNLISVLFPVNIVPLYFGLTNVNNRDSKIGLLVLAIITYLSMAFFFIVTYNYMSPRYLMIVVIMLLPFVGHGFEQIRSRLLHSRQMKIFMAGIFVLFICFPLYKSIGTTRNQKIEYRHAGEWLKQHRDVLRQRIITTDERIPFYAGLMRGNYAVFPQEKALDFERLARDSNSSIMALDVSLSDEVVFPSFSNYTLVKEFRSGKKAVLIYESVQTISGSESAR